MARPRSTPVRWALRLLLVPVGLLTVVGLGIVAVLVDDAVRGGGPCTSAVLPKAAVVFDVVTVCATGDVDDTSLVHAAAVAAQWLDNDADGTPDDPGLMAALADGRPVVVMTPEELTFWPGVRAMVALRGRTFQDLGAHETDPPWGRDAAPEEVHHVIVNAGWQRYLPYVFSEDADDNSLLYRAWRAAWGGGLHWYDDPTCDDACRVTEYVYLATAAYLGSDADLQTDELRALDREELRLRSPATVQIFESTDYRYPTTAWPDGQYPHAAAFSFQGLDGRHD